MNDVVDVDAGEGASSDDQLMRVREECAGVSAGSLNFRPSTLAPTLRTHLGDPRGSRSMAQALVVSTNKPERASRYMVPITLHVY